MGNNDTSKSSPGSHADSIRHCYHNVKIESYYFHTNLLAQKNLHLPLYGLLPSCFTQRFFLPLAPPRNRNCDTPDNFQTLHASDRNCQCREGNCLMKETDIYLKYLADFPNNAIWSAIRFKRKTFASKQIGDFTHFY